ncbi:hypothetical protein CLU79DRAFT_741925 [Phycomyces nitens]|nr:hypothetical protein CLU79DRAFT_741925 [Phycomyces nitens]
MMYCLTQTVMSYRCVCVCFYSCLIYVLRFCTSSPQEYRLRIVHHWRSERGKRWRSCIVTRLQ